MADINIRFFATICVILAVLAGTSCPATASSTPASSTTVKGMIEVTVDGKTFEGKPLAWSEREVRLLGRDGWLWSFDPRKVTRFTQTAKQFEPYSPSKIRAMLLRELGSEFEVTGSSHYMIAHRKGERDKWAQRFEGLYRSFVHYFSVRGFKLEKPPFPLIGIVCRNQEEFMRLTAQQGMPAFRGALGYYSLKSNRITLFDRGDTDSTARSWQTTASTVIHEATHQVAFNTGINSRYCPPPLWLVEGLATLFEAPGFYDSDHYRTLEDRINQVRFREFKTIPRTKNGELPAALVASDSPFRVKPGASYAEAWAMTFYLVETRPGKFAQYIKKTTNHPPFRKYTKKQRVDDFTSVFGTDWRMFDAHFMRYMSRLP